MTIKGLATASGLSERFVSDLERGKGNIAVGRLLFVARALRVPIADLVAPLDALAPESRPIALVGLRGSGKSSVGQGVADALGRRFVELDRQVEAAAGLPLSQIFEMHGEAYYRRLEGETLRTQLAEDPHAVIAVGGGVVTDSENWALLKRGAITVWLRAEPEQYYQRVLAQGDLRPMKNRPGVMSELRALLAARAPFYAEADQTIDTSSLTVEQVRDRVCETA